MHVVIIGNGISGISAARAVRSLNQKCRISVISDESDYFYSRTALMYVFMGQLKSEHLKPYPNSLWKSERITLIRGLVEHIDTERKNILFKARGDSSHTHFLPPDVLTYDRLVIACGSVPRPPLWPGAHLIGVCHLHTQGDLTKMESLMDGLKRAVIVGGGLTGVEMAEMMYARGVEVTMLVREPGYFANVLPPEESELVSAHIQSHGIDLRLNTELKSIEDDGTGRVAGVVTSAGEHIACGLVGLTIGVRPNVGWLEHTPLDIRDGILVDEYLRSSIPDIFAIGDCAELRSPDEGRRPIEAMWYTGRLMGETVARTVCSHPTSYRPGVWYNSAKFFDMLYHAYGYVPNTWQAPYASLYWAHENGRRSFRLMYRLDTGAVTGMTSLGIALRQEVCTRWIEEGATIDFVIGHLGSAHFEGELSRNWLGAIAGALRGQMR